MCVFVFNLLFRWSLEYTRAHVCVYTVAGCLLNKQFIWQLLLQYQHTVRVRACVVPLPHLEPRLSLSHFDVIVLCSIFHVIFLDVAIAIT